MGTPFAQAMRLVAGVAIALPRFPLAPTRLLTSLQGLPHPAAHRISWSTSAIACFLRPIRPT